MSSTRSRSTSTALKICASWSIGLVRRRLAPRVLSCVTPISHSTVGFQGSSGAGPARTGTLYLNIIRDIRETAHVPAVSSPESGNLVTKQHITDLRFRHHRSAPDRLFRHHRV